VGSHSRRSEESELELEVSFALLTAVDLEEESTGGVARTGGALFLIVDVVEDVVVEGRREGAEEGRGSWR